MNKINTRRAPRSPEYKVLKAKDLLCTSNRGRFALFSRVDFVGGLLDTLISPSYKSAGGDEIVLEGSAGVFFTVSFDVFAVSAMSVLGDEFK